MVSLSRTRLGAGDGEAHTLAFFAPRVAIDQVPPMILGGCAFREFFPRVAQAYRHSVHVVHSVGTRDFAVGEAEEFADNSSTNMVVPEVMPADRVVLIFVQHLRYEGLACFDRFAASSPYKRCGCAWSP